MEVKTVVVIEGDGRFVDVEVFVDFDACDRFVKQIERNEDGEYDDPRCDVVLHRINV